MSTLDWWLAGAGGVLVVGGIGTVYAIRRWALGIAL